MAAGIPVVTVDADVPNSTRLAFIGTDWYELGASQAKASGPLPQGQDRQGRHDRHSRGRQYQSSPRPATSIPSRPSRPTSRSCPPSTTAARAPPRSRRPSRISYAPPPTSSPSPASIPTAAPASPLAIKESAKIGKVFGTCVDAENEHLQGVKSGALVAAVGQKRQFFTYYGVRTLYDYNHSPIKFTDNDKKNKITNIPSKVVTGFIVATKDNVDALIAAAAAKTK